MSRLRVAAYSISLDGFGAGPGQSRENPQGVGGLALHGWAFGTRTFRRMFGAEGGGTGVDDEHAARSFENVGAWIMGRNMFAPSRGPWRDDGWKGWWGPNPPYRAQVFVLTHHARPPLLLGTGEHLFAGIDAARLGYEVVEHVGTEMATHVVLARKAGGKP